MELFPGIHRIEVHYQDRYLFQHILVGDDNVLFIDSGVATTPVNNILPYVEENKLIGEQSQFLIVTHNDADHCGGNASLKSFFPQLTIMAHQHESEDMEDPNRTLKNRYNELAHLGVSYNEDRSLQLLKNLGERCHVDISLIGQEMFHLSDDWQVQFLYSPGHTKGHMIVYDPKHKLAVITDAILGKGVYTRDGALTLCPTYRYTDMYLKTIELIEQLEVDYLLTSHFPLIKGKKEINRFIKESKQFVAIVETYILDSLNKKEKLTLKDLIDAAGHRLGNWPREKNFDLFYCLQGGLEELERKGLIQSLVSEQMVLWVRHHKVEV
ncbi:MBL fold metallo-hydrolase [Bacillus sp. Marseille-P3661]|uniref:MBL fold metallo-hydrolase n=1 Tax=Bacillus sp. Marseille-P3661 TaxID=1936234 RepID=UPI000C83F3CE|nr:MBL fold metallo-hydrolase [Bacillus sp. Marseille-P3661]